MRVATVDGTTTVDAGWTPIEDYTFLPSDFASTADGIRELTTAIGTTVTCDRDDLVASITANRDALNAASGLPIPAWK